MTHDEPGPGQTYALEARQAIAALRRQSRSRSVGARRTKESQGTRPRTSGPNWPPANQTTHGSTCRRHPAARTTDICGAGRRKSDRKRGPGASGDALTRFMCSGRRASRTRPRQGGEADGLQILPAQVWACPHGRVPQEHEQQTGWPLLVVRPGEHWWSSGTRDHLFKHCSRWKDQQAELWARVKEATKRGKRMGDLLADERCSPAVLDFLRSTYVGRAAPPVG